MTTPPKGYFCDLSLDAVDALANASCQLLRNGTTARTYGAQKREAHLEAEFDVLVVNLESLHEPFTEKGYIDHLLLFSEEAYERVWSGRDDVEAKPLSQLCVQRTLNSRPTNVPPHLSILEDQAREYIVSRYDERDASNFRGFNRALLVRSFAEKDTSLFELLRDHGMLVTYQANASCVYDGELQLLGFQVAPSYVPLQEFDRIKRYSIAS